MPLDAIGLLNERLQRQQGRLRRMERERTARPEPQEVAARAWPVGSVYSATGAKDPAERLGFGTWSPVTESGQPANHPPTFPGVRRWKRTA